MKSVCLVLVLLIGGSANAAECPEEDVQRAEARTDAGLASSLAIVYFDLGSDDVDAQFDQRIRAAAAWLAEHPRRLLILDGFTDRSGSWSANLRLSQERADRVREALVRAGADPVRIVSAAHSENHAMEAPAACNRRVVLRGTLQTFDELVEAQRGVPPERTRQARPQPRQQPGQQPRPR
jgi:outer membrane protein OmpA-like peptidoglycan-associated protein